MSCISRAAVNILIMRRKGEELAFEYRQESNRNDIALLHHFFLNGRRPARLCAYDLPRGLQKADMQEPFTDADYAPGGRLCTLVRMCCNSGGVHMYNAPHVPLQRCWIIAPLQHGDVLHALSCGFGQRCACEACWIICLLTCQLCGCMLPMRDAQWPQVWYDDTFSH